MYDVPKAYKVLLKDLSDQDSIGQNAHLVAEVELGLALLQFLCLDDEPIVALWVILSGTPIRHPHLKNLSDDQHRAIANVRILLPAFAGRFAWEAALRDYSDQIPRSLRRYDFDAHNLETQIVDAADKGSFFPAREEVFQLCLTSQLEFKKRKPKYPKAGYYEFMAYPLDGTPRPVSVELTEEDTSFTEYEVPWFTEARPRYAFTFHIGDLAGVADFIDRRESKASWRNRLQKIRYRGLNADGSLGDINKEPITLDGLAHIVGMVGAYKSTLMVLLAAYLVWQHRIDGQKEKQRITLVVGDTQNSIRLANQFNQWFCDDPEQDSPVAVPIFGRTTKKTHIEKFYSSRDYQEHLTANKAHWGERWLNTACPLQANLSLEQLDYKPITPGQEPCSSLLEPLSRGQKPKKRQVVQCPFFNICPSHQMFRDLKEAQIWITTPGALGAASLPPQLEERNIRLGELVYDQSDIVIFDEVDTIIEWFDRLYADEVQLAAAGEGILDDLDVKTTSYWSQNRIVPPATSRWINAQRQSLTVVSHILGLLDEKQGYDALRDWVHRGYFTALSLFYRLSRRLAGLKDYEDTSDPGIIRANNEMTGQILSLFEPLMKKDPLTLDKRKTAPEIMQLALIMKNLMTVGASPQEPSIIQDCKDWIQDVFPDIDKRLALLEEQLKSSEHKRDRNYRIDTIDTLAQRLEFALNAVLLDRHTRIVFYEWHNRPVDAIEGDQPYSSIPPGLMNILPVPPTGRLFGTYYSRNLRAPEDQPNPRNNRLSSFGYTNIGRSYVRDFHTLRSSLEGQPGPNVIALSGTSYLPDSSCWHFDVVPQGVLEPEEPTTDAISQSEFRFLPIYDHDNKPIRISGMPHKMAPIKQLTACLVGDYIDKGGYLRIELERLGQLAVEKPELWKDRQRLLLLVNSYDQARWVTQEIQSRWTEMKGKIFHLVRGADDDVYTSEYDGQITRTDAEEFAIMGGQILVAPMLSIGRGLNILNKDHNAAFGAIYFMTRPMPHPYDTQSISQEINRRTFDWYNDETNAMWNKDGIYARGIALREKAHEYWRSIEMRQYYATLDHNERRDLAASTAGHIIQAVGRLVRGGVPFHAFFVDAAWAPRTADRETDQLDTPKTSLLAAVIEVLADYVEDPIGRSLYQPIFKALDFTEDFDWESDN